MHLSRLIGALAVGAAVLAASSAHAQRAPVPIVDLPNVPVVTASGKPLSQEALKQAIISGGANGPRRWLIVPEGDGKTLKGTYIVRQHTVVVQIVPGSNSYSVKYADSSNMKYAVEYGKPVIHPFYNDWVDQLVRAIDFEVKKL
jgi:hypothetical protein